MLCLQEIKCETKTFPLQAFEDLGYNAAVHGQKTYNGVAILSKLPLTDIVTGLPGDDGDEQARYIEAVVSAKAGAVRVASIYLPNGNPVDTEKYPYKLAWMERLKRHARSLLALEEMLVLAGDYNVIPEPEDVYNPAAWADDALFKPETRRAFRQLVNLGLTDALRAVSGDAPAVYILGLSGRRLAEEPRPAHRPPAAVAAKRRRASRLAISRNPAGRRRSHRITCPSGLRSHFPPADSAKSYRPRRLGTVAAPALAGSLTASTTAADSGTGCVAIC